MIILLVHYQSFLVPGNFCAATSKVYTQSSVSPKFFDAKCALLTIRASGKSAIFCLPPVLIDFAFLKSTNARHTDWPSSKQMVGSSNKALITCTIPSLS